MCSAPKFIHYTLHMYNLSGNTKGTHYLPIKTVHNALTTWVEIEGWGIEDHNWSGRFQGGDTE